MCGAKFVPSHSAGFIMKKMPKQISDILSQEHRWPKQGDKLLRASENWDRGVEFISEPIQKHALLWDGYLAAGDGLVQMCLTEGYEHERHTVIYPILFNYRHGLELAMKWVILMYGDEGLSGVRNDHNLWKLWKRCREIIEATGQTDSNADDVVEKLVKEFHELDRAGINLRYGWAKSGRAMRLPKQSIDLENLRDVMEGIAGYFLGLDGWLDDLRSARF